VSAQGRTVAAAKRLWVATPPAVAAAAYLGYNEAE